MSHSSVDPLAATVTPGLAWDSGPLQMFRGRRTQHEGMKFLIRKHNCFSDPVSVSFFQNTVLKLLASKLRGMGMLVEHADSQALPPASGLLKQTLPLPCTLHSPPPARPSSPSPPQLPLPSEPHPSPASSKKLSLIPSLPVPSPWASVPRVSSISLQDLEPWPRPAPSPQVPCGPACEYTLQGSVHTG